MPRTWASGDNVFLPIGNLVGTGTSPNTLVAIAKRASDGAWMTPTAVQPSAGNPTVSMQVSSTNKLSYVSGATDKDTGITWVAADGWSLIAVDKAGGTATPNGHLYVYGTNTWTHSAAGSTVGGNSTDLTGGKVQHGRWATGDPFVGDIAIAGIWKRQLGQTEIEYLAFSLRYWYDAAPDYLVIFDQAATSQNVIDLITGNTEQSHSGAAVSTNSVPVFSYGLGVPVPSFVAGAGGDATATPAAVALTVTLPAATISAGSTTSPAATAATVALPAATVSAGSTETPAVLAATVALPGVTVSAGSTVTPAAIATVVAVPAVTVSTSGNATVAPAAIVATVALPSATGSASSTVTPTAIAATVAFPAPTIDTAGNATVTPATIGVVVAIQSVTISAGSTVTPATVAALVSVPTPATGATRKATSTAAVTAGRTSVAAVAANRTSTPGVT